MRSPENASGSAAQAAVTVLVESVKFSNHAAPASTSAAGSSQRLRVLPRFFPACRILQLLDCRYFNTSGLQRKAKRRAYAPGPSGSV